LFHMMKSGHGTAWFAPGFPGEHGREQAGGGAVDVAEVRLWGSRDTMF
jgi:hypothetical protein